jgi:Uma2 family endonuclease
MNVILPTLDGSGFSRRSFGVADITAMVTHGIIRDDENIELIDGEIITGAPETSRHGRVKNKLARLFQSKVSLDLLIADDTTLYLDEQNFVKPDIYIVHDGENALSTPGSEVLLLMEVALSSMSHDIGSKAALYAKQGIRDYWVIDCETLETTVFRDPIDGMFHSTSVAQTGQQLVPLSLSDIIVNMSKLGI